MTNNQYNKHTNYYLGHCRKEENYKDYKFNLGNYDNACLFVYSTEGVILILKPVDDKNHYCVPGGRKESHDESPIDTAIREFKEEVGTKRSFRNKEFQIFGRKHNRTWTLMIAVKVNNINRYKGRKKEKNIETIGVAVLKKLPYNIYNHRPEPIVRSNYLSIKWLDKNEYKTSKNILYPELFIYTILNLNLGGKQYSQNNINFTHLDYMLRVKYNHPN
jgi:hypothetical protein